MDELFGCHPTDRLTVCGCLFYTLEHVQFLLTRIIIS